MGRSVYTAEQKAEALALYVDLGAFEAGRQVGIPAGTIAAWASRSGDVATMQQNRMSALESELLRRAGLRETLRNRLLEKAVDMLDRMDKPHIDFKGKDADRVTYPKPSPAGCQSYATAAAILIDKLRLELGEVTGRTEHRQVDDIDTELQRLMAARLASEAEAQRVEA